MHSVSIPTSYPLVEPTSEGMSRQCGMHDNEHSSKIEMAHSLLLSLGKDTL